MAPKGPEPPKKRAKISTSNSIQKLTSVEDLRAALRVQDASVLAQNLTSLRNQITVRYNEPLISPQDERLLLAQHWMVSGPGAHDLFDLWEGPAQRQASLESLILSILSSLLDLLTSYYTYHALGHPIVKTLISQKWLRRLQNFLNGAHTELLLVTMRLFNSMSNFAGGRERKTLLGSFPWEIKTLPKLLQMRRKGKNVEEIDQLARPDIRTLYALFLLSFVSSDSTTLVKTLFLEQHRDALLAVFKGLHQDSYSVARRILEICWAGIWSDPKLKRTLKVGIFNESTVNHILKLYERTTQEGPEADHIPADLAHHFLLAICTHPGVGICFRDHGWYPRESDEGTTNVEPQEGYPTTESKSSRLTKKFGGKIHNKILANVLKTLNVNENLRQQELALKVMGACPELVSGYWTAAALTLEPRLSSKWIANISVFGAAISLPIPMDSFYLRNSSNSSSQSPPQFNPSPPPLSTILENTLPSVNTKVHFSRGLQSSSPLVQHCTALALAKCLRKYDAVRRAFKEVAETLEEHNGKGLGDALSEGGRWGNRLKELEKEVRKRVPEFQVILAFSQHKHTAAATTTSGDVPPAANANKEALLSESAQRLLWMYHLTLPDLVSEARFDSGKLLSVFSLGGVVESKQGLDEVRKLHVLRLLQGSDQFNWVARAVSSTHSNLHMLLKSYLAAPRKAIIRSSLEKLVSSLLAQSILFEESTGPDEPSLWLESLPTIQRAVGAESPDGAPLHDEINGVLAFFDDCIQRCVKVPYRYLEALQTLVTEAGHSDRVASYPSPLIMTVCEQLEAKIQNKLLSFSDILALCSFIRRLVLRLSTKQIDLAFLRCWTGKVASILEEGRLPSGRPIMASAVARELRVIEFCIDPSSPQERGLPPTEANATVLNFLNQVESSTSGETPSESATLVYELVDWLRLVDSPLGPNDIRRLAALVQRYHGPALYEFMDHLDPSQSYIWTVVDCLDGLDQFVDFSWLFASTATESLTNASCIERLVFHLPINPDSIERAICQISHRLNSSKENSQHVEALLLFLVSVMKQTDTLPIKSTLELKSYICSQTWISDLCMDGDLSELVQAALDTFIQSCLNPKLTSDREIVSHIAAHWCTVLSSSLDAQDLSQLRNLKRWISFFDADSLFQTLGTIAQGRYTGTVVVEILNSILQALKLVESSNFNVESASTTQARVQQYLTLHSLLPESSMLTDLILLGVERLTPLCINGLTASSTRLATLCASSEHHWRVRTTSLPALNTEIFLHSLWTPSTVKLVTILIYNHRMAKASFLRWLESPNFSTQTTEYLAPVLRAIVDVCPSFLTQLNDHHASILEEVVAKLMDTVSDKNSSAYTRGHCMLCVASIMTVDDSRQRSRLSALCKFIKALSLSRVTSELFSLANALQLQLTKEDFSICLLDQGLPWATRTMGNERKLTSESESIVSAMGSLLRRKVSVKAHLVEPLLSVAIKDHLGNLCVVQMLSLLLEASQLKPVVVNKHLQSVLQHPHFLQLTHLSSTTTRDPIVDLLYTFFTRHPSNTSQLSHLEPLIPIYSASCSQTDRKLLSILHMFETERRISLHSLLSRWSPNADVPAATALEALQNLDPARVLRTCLAFPAHRRLHKQDLQVDYSGEEKVYDPVFILLLFASMLGADIPENAFSWVQLFRSNAVSVLVRCLSSKDEHIRELALYQIVALYKSLQSADMQEKPQVLHILSLLRDTLPLPSASSTAARLPSYISLILLHSLRAVFYPSNFIYPLTARFLLQRPELDATDVPMLFSMLYSSSEDWKKERGWLIRFLSDGMMSTVDWAVLKRRHTWDILAGFYQSSEDRALQYGILEVLVNLTCNQVATTSLILKSGLIPWIEMQLLTSSAEDHAMNYAWVKIIDNIIWVADRERIESATNGEWRTAVARCLHQLITPKAHSRIVLTIAPLILQLSALPGAQPLPFPALISLAVERLKLLEASVDIMVDQDHPPLKLQENSRLQPPHRAYELSEPLDESKHSTLHLWGGAVESLWRASMVVDSTSCWDSLTPRLLIWRGVVGREGSEVGEWARKEVIHNMGEVNSDSAIE